MGRLLVNGIEDAGIPANDPGLVRGLTVFETMRTYGRVPFRLEQHLDRLEASAETTGIAMPPRSALRAEILAALDDDDQWVRCLLTAGGNRVIETGDIDASRIGRPVSVAFVDWEPTPWLPGSVKHTSRAAWQLAARERGVDEVIFVSTDGGLLEANRSNVVAVVDGTVCTSEADGRILAGVTRSTMLEAAGNAGLPVRVGHLPADTDFDELYLSSTMKELAPTVLGGRTLRGPVGARLLQAFRDLVLAECGTTTT